MTDNDIKRINKQIKELTQQKNKIIEQKKREKFASDEKYKIKKILNSIFDSKSTGSDDYIVDEFA